MMWLVALGWNVVGCDAATPRHRERGFVYRLVVQEGGGKGGMLVAGCLGGQQAEKR